MLCVTKTKLSCGTNNLTPKNMNNKQQKESRMRIIFAVAVVGTLSVYSLRMPPARSAVEATDMQKSITKKSANEEARKASSRSEEVIPSKGSELSIQLRDLGPELVKAGVINKEKFLSIYAKNAALKKEAEKLLGGATEGNFVITRENAPVVLNFLWAFGLGNKNPILEKGPMMDPVYKGAGNFASTGGWTLADGDAMTHYSKHEFVVLTALQQDLVERVSKNIYRPCCGNSTYFPDCNHGMAMLGLLELMASQGVSETDMYRVVLSVNAYWFPDTYLTIAKYLEKNGRAWRTADPKELLGANYSSGPGYQKIVREVEPVKGSAGSCGV